MEINFTSKNVIDNKSFLEDISGYYLISLKWSMLNDPYITFVRQNALAYCYDINWAGPLTKFEIDRVVKSEKIIVISHQTINKYIVKVNDKLFLPNTIEVRKLIGLKDDMFQMAN
ncbi:hypothetical protein [Flavobacterium faecale]|uniref:hypothetical protein n=1 Tax=Flavobacterium faecale TaxID=1355330 RepID=UPI003AB003A9